MPLQIRSNCCSGVQLSARMLYLFNNIIQLQQNSTVMHNHIYKNINMAYEYMQTKQKKSLYLRQVLQRRFFIKRQQLN